MHFGDREFVFAATFTKAALGSSCLGGFRAFELTWLWFEFVLDFRIIVSRGIQYWAQLLDSWSRSAAWDLNKTPVSVSKFYF